MANCPNHLCQLLKTGEPTKQQCPISSCYFVVKPEETILKLDKYGNVMEQYTIISGGEDEA